MPRVRIGEEYGKAIEIGYEKPEDLEHLLSKRELLADFVRVFGNHSPPGPRVIGEAQLPLIEVEWVQTFVFAFTTALLNRRRWHLHDLDEAKRAWFEARCEDDGRLRDAVTQARQCADDVVDQTVPSSFTLAWSRWFDAFVLLLADAIEHGESSLAHALLRLTEKEGESGQVAHYLSFLAGHPELESYVGRINVALTKNAAQEEEEIEISGWLTLFSRWLRRIADNDVSLNQPIAETLRDLGYASAQVNTFCTQTSKSVMLDQCVTHAARVIRELRRSTSRDIEDVKQQAAKRVKDAEDALARQKQLVADAELAKARAIDRANDTEKDLTELRTQHQDLERRLKDAESAINAWKEDYERSQRELAAMQTKLRDVNRRHGRVLGETDRADTDLAISVFRKQRDFLIRCRDTIEQLYKSERGEEKWFDASGLAIEVGAFLRDEGIEPESLTRLQRAERAVIDYLVSDIANMNGLLPLLSELRAAMRQEDEIVFTEGVKDNVLLRTEEVSAAEWVHTKPEHPTNCRNCEEGGHPDFCTTSAPALRTPGPNESIRQAAQELVIGALEERGGSEPRSGDVWRIPGGEQIVFSQPIEFHRGAVLRVNTRTGETEVTNPYLEHRYEFVFRNGKDFERYVSTASTRGKALDKAIDDRYAKLPEYKLDESLLLSLPDSAGRPVWRQKATRENFEEIGRRTGTEPDKGEWIDLRSRRTGAGVSGHEAQLLEAGFERVRPFKDDLTLYLHTSPNWCKRHEGPPCVGTTYRLVNPTNRRRELEKLKLLNDSDRTLDSQSLSLASIASVEECTVGDLLDRVDAQRRQTNQLALWLIRWGSPSWSLTEGGWKHSFSEVVIPEDSLCVHAVAERLGCTNEALEKTLREIFGPKESTNGA